MYPQVRIKLNVNIIIVTVRLHQVKRLKKFYQKIELYLNNEITMRELTNCRSAIGTRFTFECVNEDYPQKETFYTK